MRRGWFINSFVIRLRSGRQRSGDRIDSVNASLTIVPPDTRLGRLVRRRRADLRAVAARHGATNLRLFGSVACGQDGPHSDVDLVVDLPETTSLLELIALRRELAELLGTSVDVVPARSLRPEVAAEIERDAIRL
jgi:predicted nucleotidyltransferase